MEIDAKTYEVLWGLEEGWERGEGGGGCLIDNVFGQWTTVLPWTNNAFAHIL